MVELDVQTEGLREAMQQLEKLGSADMAKVLRRVVKRAATAAQAKAASASVREYTISASGFKKYSTVTASGDQSVTMTFSGHVVPLLNFSTSYDTKGRITTQVKRGGIRAALDHAFVARANGGIFVAERDSGRRTIHGLFGPSTAHMVRNEAVRDAISERAREVFQERLKQELDWNGGKA